jgi:uncharacterized metal-binding protein
MSYFGVPIQNGLGLGLLPVATLASTQFTPAALFASGEQGAWYDPSDVTTLFQDVAGTSPVTTVGQRVARINDKSGRDNHATQATAASQPIYQIDTSGRPYLTFDGVDDSLATASINFTGTSSVTAFVGSQKSSDAAIGVVFEFGPVSSTTNGTFGFFAPIVANIGNYRWRTRGTLVSDVDVNGFAAPDLAVLTLSSDIPTDNSFLRRNGTQVANSVQDMGTGAFGTQILYVGRRTNTNLPFNGRIYNLIIRGATTPLTTIQQTETWLNAITGAY